MKRRSILTTIIAFLLLAAVIAAGINAIFTITYVQATFRTYTERGAAAAESLKEELNGFLNKSSTFLDLSEVRAVVEEDPRFEVVEIRKDYPETLVVEVTERREAFAVAAGDGTYHVLDEVGNVLGSVSSAEGYILLEGFTLTVENAKADGAHFDEVLAVYGAMQKHLGEVRANVISVALEAPAEGWTLFRIRMREGAQIVLLNPAERAGEMAEAATKVYLGTEGDDWTDADRILSTITVSIVKDDGRINIGITR